MKKFITILRQFGKDKSASVAILMSLSMIPAMGIVGAAIDYGRAVRTATHLQIAIDAATLNGAIITVQDRNALSQATFSAALSEDGRDYAATASFSTTHDATLGSVYHGVATATIKTTLMKIVGIETITISKRSKAQFGTGDNSCILTLGGELNLDDEVTTFNGSPNIDLTGCSIRSNKSIKCNGHSTGAKASIAAGNVTNCPGAVAGAGIVPDIHAGLSEKIVSKCGSTGGSVTWDTSNVPIGPNVLTYSRTGYQEVHICGNLKLTGTGILAGASTSKDLLIIVENGDINVNAGANISAPRTTIVFGVGSGSATIKYPNGNGHSAKLAISSSQSTTNPWASIALYQDPRPSGTVDLDWGPGATLVTDGINYLSRSEIVLSGNAQTGPSNCSKLVAFSFRINGAVSLKQNATGCANHQVNQFRASPRLLS